MKNYLMFLSLLLAAGLVPMQAFGQGVSESRNAPVWNVAVEGQHQPGDDITETLQRGLDSQYLHGMPVYIPGGRWLCGEITFPYRSGVRLMGACNAESLTTGGSISGMVTVLQYSGDADGTMFSVTGNDTQISHLTLLGETNRDNPYDGTGAKIGILLKRPAHTIGEGASPTGLGTGRLRVANVNFEQFDIGAQLGDSTQNSDNTRWDWIKFRNCNTDVFIDDEQAMRHTFNHVLDYNYDIDVDAHQVFHSNAGGHIYVFDLLQFRGTTLKLTGSSADIGRNNGLFHLSFGKWDSQADSNIRLVNSTNPGNIDICVENWNHSYTSLAPEDLVSDFATLSGSNHLTLTRFRGLMGPITGTASSGVVPTVTLLDCQLFGQGENNIAGLTQGDVDFKVVDCRREGHGFKPDFRLRIEGDVPVLGSAYHRLLRDPSLIGHVSCNGRLFSSSPNDMTFSYSGTASYVDGPHGKQAVVCDPSGLAGLTGVQVSRSDHPLGNQYTLSGWFRTIDNSVVQGLIAKDGFWTGGGGQNWGTMVSSSGKFRFAQSHTTLFEQDLDANTWLHVAVVIDGSAPVEKAKVYLDGVEEYVSDATFVVADTKDVWFGRDFNNGNKILDGDMADLWVFDRALTAEEIQTLYEGEK